MFVLQQESDFLGWGAPVISCKSFLQENRGGDNGVLANRGFA